MSPTIELQCWLVLASSVITSASAVLALVADRYQESLPENIALVSVALAGFIVTLQIFVTGYAQMSGFTFMASSVALYAAQRAYKKWRELYP
jgi:hypothetical protein